MTLLIAVASLLVFFVWRAATTGKGREKWTPVEPAWKTTCNPYTSETVRGGCLCKYPDLVVNDGGSGDCNHAVGCLPHGILVHKTRETTFDGTWDPEVDGKCKCQHGYRADGFACIVDKCGPNGRWHEGVCVCDNGFIAAGASCIRDPCQPNGHLSHGKCQCDPGYVPVQDQSVPGKWACLNPCENNNLCGNRGACKTDGQTMWCDDCIYPFHQSADKMCRGTPKDPFEECSADNECTSLNCKCKRNGKRV